jgi:hypothetical protein
VVGVTMPWCETCSRFLNPNTLHADGTCPACGRQVAEPGSPQAATRQKAPWHFKLLVLATVVYLGWRFFEVIEWVVGRF